MEGASRTAGLLHVELRSDFVVSASLGCSCGRGWRCVIIRACCQSHLRHFDSVQARPKSGNLCVVSGAERWGASRETRSDSERGHERVLLSASKHTPNKRLGHNNRRRRRCGPLLGLLEHLLTELLTPRLLICSPPALRFILSEADARNLRPRYAFRQHRASAVGVDQ